MWLEFHIANINFYLSKKISKGLKNVTVMKKNEILSRQADANDLSCFVWED